MDLWLQYRGARYTRIEKKALKKLEAAWGLRNKHSCAAVQSGLGPAKKGFTPSG